MTTAIPNLSIFLIFRETAEKIRKSWILFVGSGGENDSAFLQELDSKGNEMHRIDFKSANIFAAYFRDKIVAAADKLRILESDLTVNAEFEQLKYPRIKAFEKSFFILRYG